MKRTAIVAAFALSVFGPAAALAQPNPAPPVNGGPSADARAAMMKARDDARVAAYAALSADHRTKVQAIIDQVNAGKLTDPRGAAQQIDAILTPDESKAVLAQHDKLRAAMEQAHAAMGGPNGGPPPGGPGPGGPGAAPGGPGGMGPDAHHGGPNGAHGMMNDAGFVLLQLAVDPQVMRALHHNAAGQPPRQ
ncbi:MAG: hypothetical protein JOZ24_12065 [Candidatus Eremiobacteraeota bacterium]|nr:hypothetical protein [Candidatus Eremiobacteraeota bacterium]